MNKEGRPIRTFIIQNCVWLLSVTLAIINLWILAKLAPLNISIATLNTRVDAIEERQAKVDATLIRYETKLDTIIWEIGNLKQVMKK